MAALGDPIYSQPNHQLCYLGVELDPTDEEPVERVEDVQDDPGAQSDDSHNGSIGEPSKEMKLKAGEYSVSPYYRIVVPIGKETVEAVLKGITRLWVYQKNDASNPSKFPKPCDSKLVHNAKESYYRRLVMDSLTSWPDRGVYCSLRDGYSVDDFIRMMVKLWKGFATWDRRTTLIRDRMAINLRHQAFFRDQSLRMMALSDCFRESISTSFSGTTGKVHGLTFCLRAGKTQPDFKTDFAMVLRHKNYIRCGVGATAFCLFERFHVS
jgi:hypothetical protein